MTVSTEVDHNEYTGNGVTTSFPYTFRIFKKTDLVVQVSDLNGSVTELVMDTGYTVTGAGTYSGGSVVLPSPLAAGWRITIERVLDVVQETDLRNQGKFFPEVHEDAFDYLTMLIQRCFGWFRRALMKPSLLAKYYDAKQNRISNLADPSLEQDAVNNRSMRNYVDAAIAGVVGGFGWFIQYGSGAVYRTFQDKMRDTVSVRDFGAKGDGFSDDTQYIQQANDTATSIGATLHFPRGVYVCTDGIDKTCEWTGVGAAKIGVFPLNDDKVYMVPGNKHKLPGTCLLFKGTGSKVFTTGRSDKFSSMRYCIRNVGRKDKGLTAFGRDFSVVCDFDFKDQDGNITQPNNDNSADYDVGLILDNTDLSGPVNVTVGGYFKKSGIVHMGQDPDGCTIINTRTMGNIGLAIIGDQTGTNSAFNMHGGAIFGNDHHSRNTEQGVEKWGEHALYIDIPSSSGNGSRNGISFYGTWLATKLDVPVKYDRCGAVQYFGVVFENATQAGSQQAGGIKKQIGTSNTGDIGFFGCRFNSDQIRISGALLETATESTVIVSGSNAGYGVEFWKGKVGGRFTGSKNQTNIQLTDDPTKTTSGIVLRRDNTGNFHVMKDNDIKLSVDDKGIITRSSYTVVTVSAGEITVTRNFHRLSGGAQELSTINGGNEGMRVILTRNTSADDITLKNQIGNLRINGDFMLGAFDTIELIYIGGYWNEISRVNHS